MRIFKYLLLLALLLFIALTVHIATQDGTYNVTRTYYFKSPKSTVFEFVSDLKNWETFGSWKADDSSMKFIYPEKSIGSGGSFSFAGANIDGNLTTLFTKESDSISQKLTLNDESSTFHWKFVDTKKGTEVTWNTKGKMSVFFKIYCFFNGGVDHIFGTVFNRSLKKLDKTLRYELNTFSIKVNGTTNRKGIYYLGKKLTSQKSSLNKNVKIVLQQIDYFFTKNKLKRFGAPFVYYENDATSNNIITYVIGIPVEKQINLAEESDISSGFIEPFTCLKTTLYGDYSHRVETWKKALEYCTNNGLKQNFAGKYMEKYVKTSRQNPHPSKWITELYIPVFPKAEVAKTTLITTSVQSIEPLIVEPKPVAE
jgi:effector-binding domain-containing protein